jgi:hypothetical protein
MKLSLDIKKLMDIIYLKVGGRIKLLPDLRVERAALKISWSVGEILSAGEETSSPSESLGFLFWRVHHLDYPRIFLSRQKF